jgi:hypothetical protein
MFQEIDLGSGSVLEIIDEVLLFVWLHYKILLK